jgi:hypothetical protein
MRSFLLALPLAVLASLVTSHEAGAQRFAPAAFVRDAAPRPAVVTPGSPLAISRDTLPDEPRESLGMRVATHALAGGAIGVGVGLVAAYVDTRNQRNNDLASLEYLILAIFGGGAGLIVGAIQGAATAR